MFKDNIGILFYGFQFLIGRLDTQNARLKNEDNSLFQFLIGRLDTALGLLRCKKLIAVSIPHR